MLIVDLLAITLAVAFEPIPLSVLILVLSGPNGTRRGMWFLAGWVLCVLAVILIGLALGHGAHDQAKHHAATWTNWIKFLAGLALIYFAFRERKSSDSEAKEPRWMRGIDHLRGLPLAGIAAFLSPQVVVFAGTLVIVDMKLSGVLTGVLALAFLLLSCSPYVALVGIAVFRPTKSREQLDSLRRWLDSHRQQVLFIMFLVIGLYLSARAIYALAR